MANINQITDPLYITEKGQPNGVATLDAGGKVPVSQLPNSIMEYKGNWDASTNTPTLVDGTGNTGDVYRVSVAGTQFTPPISFNVGDYVIYNGTKYEKSDATDAVTSVNGFTGAVVLTTTNIAEGTNLYFTTTRARNSLIQGTGINYDPVTGIISTVNNGTVTSVGLSSSDITVGGATSPITTSGTYTLTLPNINANVGTFNNLTVNAKGQVTAASNVAYLTTETDPVANAKSITINVGTGLSRTVGAATQTVGANPSFTLVNTAPDQTVVLNNGTGISVTGTYPTFTITNTAPNAIPNLSQVLAVGSAGGLNNITLGTAGNITFTAYQNVRSVSSVDYTSSIGISTIPELSISLSNGTAAQNKALLIPFAGTTVQYTPNNGTNKYDIWHANNHQAGSAVTPTLTGANVLASLTSNSAGHITGATTRTLTPTDIGAAASNIPLSTVLTNGNTANNNIVLGANGNTNQYLYSAIRSISSVNYTANIGVGSSGTTGGFSATSSDGSGSNTKILFLPYSGTAPQYSPNGGVNYYDVWHSNNHPAGGPANNATFTGASVPALIASNSAGHITSVTARALTPADIGAAPASASANYIQNTTSPQASSNFYISGNGISTGLFQVRKNGSDSVLASFQLSNSTFDRGVNFQLNGSTNPGLATWLHNGTSWIKRAEQFADTGLLRIISEANTGETFGVYRPSNIATGSTGSVRFEAQNNAAGIVPYGQIWGIIDANTAGAENGSLAFNTRTSGAVTEKMRLASNGILTVNNDIVSTSAGSTGTITARSTSTGDAVLTADVSGVSSTSIRTYRTGGRTAIINNANEAITILTNANVGFGQTNPTGKVDILTGTGTEIQFSGSSVANIYQSVSAQGFFINSNTGLMSLGAGGSGSQHLNIVSSGLVGIGTISPQFPLHVSSGNTLGATIQNTTAVPSAATGAFLRLYQTGTPSAAGHRIGGFLAGSNPTGTTTRTGAQIEFLSTEAWVDGSSHPTDVRLLTTGSGEIAPSERMRITSDGRVCINTPTPDPSSMLTVEGMITATGLQNPSDLQLSAGAGSTMFLSIGSFTSYLTSDGLGIGTLPDSARASRLEVEGNAWCTDAWILGLSGSSVPTAEFGLAGSGAFIRTMNSSASLSLESNLTTRLLLQATGGVKLNTSLLAPIRSVAVNTALTINDHTIIANANSIVLTLPTGAAINGTIYRLVNNNKTGVTVSPAVLLNGVSTTAFAANAKWTVQYDGTSWYVIQD